MTSQRIAIGKIIPDEKNANLGSERGRQMIAESLQQLAAGRSIVLDKDLNVIAGNKTLEESTLRILRVGQKWQNPQSV